MSMMTVKEKLGPVHRRSFIELDLPLLIDAAFAAGAAMISFGALLGKVPLAQLTWLLMLETIVYAFNAYLATEARKSSGCHVPAAHVLAILRH